MNTVKADNSKAAYGLLSPEYRDRLQAAEKKAGEFNFRNNGLQQDARDYSRFESWRITAEEMAPGGGEAKFKGELVWTYSYLDSKTPEMETIVLPFTLIVTKGKEAGVWRVSVISVARGTSSMGPLRR